MPQLVLPLQQKIEALEDQIEETKGYLSTIIDYAIAYFKRLKADYGKGKERKTSIKGNFTRNYRCDTNSAQWM